MVVMNKKSTRTKTSSTDLFDFADSLAKSWKIGADNHISLRSYIVEKMSNLQQMRDPFSLLRHVATTISIRH